MSYKEIKPDFLLANYIDAYWISEGEQRKCIKTIILPDNCVDLIFNLGEIYQGDSIMNPEKTYLVGTMTTFKESVIYPPNKLVGVRFKPASFSCFYKYAPLNVAKDQTIEFEKALSPDIHKVEKEFAPYLDEFFLNRLHQTANPLFKVVSDIQAANGLIKLNKLAKQHFTTLRQLERNFKKHIGISPKEFSNIVRFKTALSKIKHNKNQDSLFEIAYECGYYDHAHLCNEIKRYAGVVPSNF